MFVAHSPGAAAADQGALQTAAAALLAAGQEAWPQLRLPPAAMIAHAAGRPGPAAASAEAPAAIAALRAGDLYLACACAEGVPGAAEALDAQFLGAAPLRNALRRSGPASGFADEVRQALREKLLLG